MRPNLIIMRTQVGDVIVEDADTCSFIILYTDGNDSLFLYSSKFGGHEINWTDMLWHRSYTKLETP